MQTNNFIDFEDGLRRVGGNTEFYKRLIKTFAGSDHIGSIVSAVSSGDFTQAARAAHALKGVSANLSFKSLHAASQELEANLKNNLQYEQSLITLESVLSDTLKCIDDFLNG